jgi:TetR/AcrR family transcriptional repressor of nem operon
MHDDRMCLCGMLAAEYATLPAPMQEGQRAGSFWLDESPRERARAILGSLEGAMLVARSYRDPQRFQAAAKYVLADLGAARHSARSRPGSTRRSQRY